MKPFRTLIVLAAAAGGACTGGTPEVMGLDPATRGPIRPVIIQDEIRTTSDVRTLERAVGASESSTDFSCDAWVTETEVYDDATGAFEYVYTCPSGGDIARVRDVGSSVGGTGSFVVTYTLRDGSTIVWNYAFAPGAAPNSQITTGTSDRGSSYASLRNGNGDGTYTTHEVLAYLDGIYTTDGTFSIDGDAGTGTQSFDDPSTPASPDSTSSFTSAADGSGSAHATGISRNGWAFTTDNTWDAAGAWTQDFTSNDPATTSSPDYTGTYGGAGDGGVGDWSQAFDDGSSMELHEEWSATSWRQDWSWNDPALAPTPDQDGSITYIADGSGSGWFTDHFADGSSRTCDLLIDAAGTSTITNCR